MTESELMAMEAELRRSLAGMDEGELLRTVPLQALILFLSNAHASIDQEPPAAPIPPGT